MEESPDTAGYDDARAEGICPLCGERHADESRHAHERDLLEQHQRSMALVDLVAEPTAGYFTWRRIPGTGALALTNLFSAGLLISPSAFNTVEFHVFSRAILPARGWGLLFLTSAVALLVAVFTRRLLWLNIGAVISLFAWTAVSLAVLSAWFLGRFTLSPVAGGLYFWMVAGQAAMLTTPLIGRYHGGGRT